MKPRLDIHITADRLWAEAWNGGRAPGWHAESARLPDQALADALTTLLVEMPRGGPSPEVSVFLHRPMAQVRHLDTLPPVRGQALQALVDHQASTFFRKNGHPLITSAAWLSGTKESPRRAVMAAVEIEVAEAVVEGLGRAGYVVDRCTVAGLAGGDSLNLLPEAARASRNQRRRRSVGRTAAIAGLAWVLAITIWIVRYGLEVHRTRADLNRLEGARRALLAGQAVRHRAEDILTTLDAANVARQRLQDQVLAVAAGLPDSAYLSSLSLDTLGRGLLTGGARQGTEVVAALERTHAASNPRLEGVVTPDPLGTARWERFTILLGEGRP